jgi:DNA-binding HxlR family transcriptional regulator
MDKETDDKICPLEYGLRIFGKKWESKVICVLSSGRSSRYGEIRAKVEGITDVALTATLKKLTADGIVERVQYKEIPPRVDYSLTAKGKTVVPIIKSICSLSKGNGENPLVSCENCTSEVTDDPDRQ